MNMIETIKQETLRLIGLVLITIPIMAYYPILRFLDFSSKIATVATACLSGVGYVLLVTHIELFLSRVLPFMYSEVRGNANEKEHQ